MPVFDWIGGLESSVENAGEDARRQDADVYAEEHAYGLFGSRLRYRLAQEDELRTVERWSHFDHSDPPV